MLRLFLDANVLFSAALSDTGTAGSLYQLTAADMCELLTSAYAYSEARRNVELKRTNSLDRLARLMRSTREVPEPTKRSIRSAEQFVPSKDAPILAAAIACGAEALVTGDRRHFGELYRKSLAGVLVLSPRQALELVLSS